MPTTPASEPTTPAAEPAPTSEPTPAAAEPTPTSEPTPAAAEPTPTSEPALHQPEELLPHQQLHLSARKGRYGVAYLRAIAGQAGCGFNETAPGEDTLAFDYTLDFPEGGVRVQVKTSAQYAIEGDDESLSFSAKDKWIAKWARIKVPLYFVIVVVPDDSGSWLNHDTNGTHMVRTAAYWVRLDPELFADSKTIKVPRSQRVTVDTLPGWHRDLCDLFTPRTEDEEAA